jgi:hypothetical protein
MTVVKNKPLKKSEKKSSPKPAAKAAAKPSKRAVPVKKGTSGTGPRLDSE